MDYFLKIIKLLSLQLKNFKRIKDLHIDFGNETNIFGENGTGKTTINDAFTWLLFNKDSHDVAKFGIQPTDKNNNIIDHLETEVTATLEINGVNTVLSKIYKQKWSRKKGTEKPELATNTNDYYVDEVPQKEKEYQQKINDIIPENIFKLLTIPLYFSSILTWKDRRKIIFDINGDLSQEDIINYNSQLEELYKLLKPNENMEDFQKRIKAQINKLKKDRENLPARIDECYRSIKKVDLPALEFRKKVINGGIKSIETQLLDNSAVNENLLSSRNKLYKLKNQVDEIKYQATINSEKPLKQFKQDLDISSSKKTILEYQFSNMEFKITQNKNKLDDVKKDIEKLYKEWDIENAKILEFPGGAFECPTCHRKFETEDIETKKQEMTENFNQEKVRKLNRITIDGKASKASLEKFEKENVDLTEQKMQLTVKMTDLNELEIKNKAAIENFKPDLSLDNNPEYQDLKKQIEELENELQQPTNVDYAIRELKNKRLELQGELEEVNGSLALKDQNASLMARIEELTAQEKSLGEQISNLERADYLSDEFTKTKVELLEGSINSKFKDVKIKLFKKLGNGGIEDCCEVLVDGIPFSPDLNSGARLNAGLDIINTLSRHYKVTAPIFIDNAESVTKLIPVNTQLIRLVVSAEDKILRIERED